MQLTLGAKISSAKWKACKWHGKNLFNAFWWNELLMSKILEKNFLEIEQIIGK